MEGPRESFDGRTGQKGRQGPSRRARHAFVSPSRNERSEELRTRYEAAFNVISSAPWRCRLRRVLCQRICFVRLSLRFVFRWFSADRGQSLAVRSLHRRCSCRRSTQSELHQQQTMLMSEKKHNNDPSDLWWDNVVMDNDVANFTEEQCLQLAQDYTGGFVVSFPNESSLERRNCCVALRRCRGIAFSNWPWLAPALTILK